MEGGVRCSFELCSIYSLLFVQPIFRGANSGLALIAGRLLPASRATGFRIAPSLFVPTLTTHIARYKAAKATPWRLPRGSETWTSSEKSTRCITPGLRAQSTLASTAFHIILVSFASKAGGLILMSQRYPAWRSIERHCV